MASRWGQTKNQGIQNTYSPISVYVHRTIRHTSERKSARQETVGNEAIEMDRGL